MDGTTRLLTLQECHELLGTSHVGRVALATPVGTRIVPVNYALHRDSIVFRTSPYSELGVYGADASAAFEVDNLDHNRDHGWAVTATGRLAVVEDPDEVADIRRACDPTPWAGGLRTLYLRLSWRELSGCHLGEPRTPAATGDRRVS